ncbi:hypothetical protein JD844_001137 [Phrynosoma platyrhinos]|uniref:Mitochondrial fission 1 protein n=1 Tax=Phrynosoma platyrhinos TaxID=52577 RepID=A0ABQ7T9Q9_PHRPL|nr:hypothetical protein JD844_001137 [Phrynosoma platyrhinos]
MESVLSEVVALEDLQRFEKKYSAELKAGSVSKGTKFEYAWCLEYEKALKYIRGLLKTEPGNTQALELEKLINKAMQKDGLVGMAIVGGMALGAAGLAGLIGLAISKAKS